MRKYGKIDENQRLIVAALRDVGASVVSLASVGNGCPDVLCAYHGVNYLLEIKRDEKATLTDDQKIFHSRWNTPISVVITVEDALRAIGAISKKGWNGKHAR